jgi:hypothetical protein
MKRYRDDSVKPGRGISGNKGATFTDNAQDPWSVQPDNARSERAYSRLDKDNGGDQHAEYGKSQFNPTRPDDFMFRAAKRDIFDDVSENGDPGFSAPIAAGVNKSQS